MDHSYYIQRFIFLTGKNALDLFVIAAEANELSKEYAQMHFKTYMKTCGEEIPWYVKKFLEEGKETMDNIKSVEFNQLFFYES